MEIVKLKLSQIKPYKNNPRKNDGAVDAVAESIRQCGYCAPIVVDEDHVILAGHTRYKALKKLGWADAEVCVRAGLSEEQKRKYRILDNKTNEFAAWDLELLESELKDLDFDGFDFGFEKALDDAEQNTSKYSSETKIPQYEPHGDAPDVTALINRNKVDAMLEEIDAADVSEAEKSFLRLAACGHAVIDFDKVADYYANASPAMQQLMERSALVLIDINDAIANGFTTLTEALDDVFKEDLYE